MFLDEFVPIWMKVYLTDCAFPNPFPLTLASDSMAGSITRRLLLNNTSERPDAADRAHLRSHAAQVRARLDICGRHWGACARSGRLRARAVGPERSLARVCREAGATVRTNTLLRDMNLCVPAFDARAIEVLATGVPLHNGVQLAVDVGGMRWGPPKCIPHRWYCPHCCSARQRTEVSRTSGQREVPASGGRHGDWWQMEQ